MSNSSYREVLAELTVTEEKCAVFYERLVHLFRDHDDIASFWRSMAADERQHRDILTKLLENLGPGDLDEAADADIRGRMIAMGEFVEQDAETVPADLEEAYQLAEKCEQLEVVPLILLLSKSAVPDRARDYMLEQQIEVHNRRLTVFDKESGGPEMRQAIPSRP